MNVAHPKTNITETFFAKLCFDFIPDILTIELSFSQQVAAEDLKNFKTLILLHKSERSWVLFYCDRT
jgi:hypothetical protein